MSEPDTSLEAEPTEEEVTALAKHLGIEGKPTLEQYEAMIQYGEKAFTGLFQNLLDQCPPEYRAEFKSRVMQNPATSGFAEFVHRIMPLGVPAVLADSARYG